MCGCGRGVWVWGEGGEDGGLARPEGKRTRGGCVSGRVCPCDHVVMCVIVSGWVCVCVSVMCVHAGC